MGASLRCFMGRGGSRGATLIIQIALLSLIALIAFTTDLVDGQTVDEPFPRHADIPIVDGVVQENVRRLAEPMELVTSMATAEDEWAHHGQNDLTTKIVELDHQEHEQYKEISREVSLEGIVGAAAAKPAKKKAPHEAMLDAFNSKDTVSKADLEMLSPAQTLSAKIGSNNDHIQKPVHVLRAHMPTEGGVDPKKALTVELQNPDILKI